MRGKTTMRDRTVDRVRELLAAHKPSPIKPSTEAVIRDAPDLVIEILSTSTEVRDRGLKRRLYEKFGVREYWLVDPEGRAVEILRRSDEALEMVAEAGKGDTLTTPLLPELAIAIEQLFET